MAKAKAKYVAVRTRQVQLAQVTLELVEGEPVEVPDEFVDYLVEAGHIAEAS